MKHKLIYGGIGVVIAGAAIGVPLGIALNTSKDNYNEEHRRLEEQLVATASFNFWTKNNGVFENFIPGDVSLASGDEIPAGEFPSDFSIPASITSLPDNAFKNAILPDDFIIPTTIKSIGKHAFEGATIPMSFKIPQSVIDIKVDEASATNKYAFTNAEFDEEYAPDFYTFISINGNTDTPQEFKHVPQTDWRRITTIPPRAFKGQTLGENFTLPNTIKNISSGAFEGATLPAGFKIPTSVFTVEPGAFKDATLATENNSFVVNDLNTIMWLNSSSWATTDVRGSTPTVGPRGWDRVSDIKYPDLSNPDSWTGITKIPSNAFANKANASLPTTAVNLTIPNTVQTADRGAFRDFDFASLASQNIDLTTWMFINSSNYSHSKTDDYINPTWTPSDSAFTTKFTLVNSQLPNIRVLPNGAFADTILPGGFTIPSSVYKLGVGSFENTVFPNGFALPSSITDFGSQAFFGASFPVGFVVPTGYQIGNGDAVFGRSTIRTS